MYHSAEDLPSRDPLSHNAYSSPPPNYWGCLETCNHISKGNSPWFSENQALTPIILSCRAMVPVQTRRSHIHLLVLTPQVDPFPQIFSPKACSIQGNCEASGGEAPTSGSAAALDLYPSQLALNSKEERRPSSTGPCVLTSLCPDPAPPTSHPTRWGEGLPQCKLLLLQAVEGLPTHHSPGRSGAPSHGHGQFCSRGTACQFRSGLAAR